MCGCVWNNCEIKSCSCGSVVEHCDSSVKGHGFNSQGTHILIKKMYSLNCKLLWIKRLVNVKFKKK